jgi:hypothetical protein
MENLKKKLEGQVKDQDFFGHPISWNFNRQGESHNTLLGGIISMFIKLAFTFYVSVKVRRFVLHEGSENSSATILAKMD